MDTNSDETSSDEAVSQFLAITGSLDASQAQSYLEMSANDLQAAISLFFEHQSGGGMGGMGSNTGTGSNSTGTDTTSSRARNSGGSGSRRNHNRSSTSDSNLNENDGIRAPDQTRTMRLMDFEGGMGPSAFGVGAGNPSDLAGLMNHPVLGRHAAAALMGMDINNMNVDGAANGGVGIEMPLPNMSAFADDGDGDFNMDIDGGVRDRINALAASSSSAASGGGSAGTDGTTNGNVDGTTSSSSSFTSRPRPPSTQRLADMFAAPSHLIHRGGGFQGARNVAKDSRRWLLVNLQCDADFACHALNRDVWRDELVENLVREGFVFWQDVNSTPDGRTYEQRYGN